MKIAHFLRGRCNPDNANGVDKTIFHLSRTQGALGNDVTVFSITGKSPIPIPGVEVKTYKPQGFAFKIPPHLLEDLWHWNADILHLHSVHSPQNIILGKLSRDRGLPYVVTVNGALFPVAMQRRRILKKLFGAILERRFFNATAFMHAICDSEKQALLNYGFTGDTVIAPNGIDLETIPHRLNEKLLTQRYPEVLGKRVIMFLGRLAPQHKGLEMLVRGIAKAPKNNTIFVLVGPDWRGGRQRLETLVRDLGIRSRVIFTGPAYGHEKFDFLASADVFVHTSRWEAGVPFSVLEAAGIGLPCIVTRPADPNSLFSAYRGGIVVDVNVESIVLGLSQIARLTHEELINMGTNARRMVKIEFDWERTARTLIDAYSKFKRG